jgi:hypothetical protein
VFFKRKKWAVCKFVKRGTTGKKVLGSILASTTKGAQLARQRVSPVVIIKDLLISFFSLLAGTELIETSQPNPCGRCFKGLTLTTFMDRELLNPENSRGIGN